MKRKFYLILTLLFAGFLSMHAQQIAFCNDVDEHDGKCKPMEAKSNWKLTNGQLSIFALITFENAPAYKRLQVKVVRNGEAEKPYFTDDITTYTLGEKCISTSLVFNKKGGYHVQVLDDDDKVLFEGDLFVS